MQDARQATMQSRGIRIRECVSLAKVIRWRCRKAAICCYCFGKFANTEREAAMRSSARRRVTRRRELLGNFSRDTSNLRTDVSPNSLQYSRHHGTPA